MRNASDQIIENIARILLRPNILMRDAHISRYFREQWAK